MSRNAKREAAREKARLLREEQKRKARRTRFIVQGSVILVSLAIISVVTLVIVNSIRPPAPGPLNMQSDGIKIATGFEAVATPALQAGDDPVPHERDPESTVISIRIYVDYLCPFCGAFDATNGEQIATWVEDGAATVEVHPISFLDRLSQGTAYSTRSASAAACVANYDPNSFFDFNTAMFANQPAESTPGLTNEEIFAVAEGVGVTQADEIQQCISEVRFKSWVQDVTERAINGPIPDSDVSTVTATPTVIVNGQRYPGAPDDAAAFAAFVIQAAGTSFNEGATPSPTPTPTPAP